MHHYIKIPKQKLKKNKDINRTLSPIQGWANDGDQNVSNLNSNFIQSFDFKNPLMVRVGSQRNSVGSNNDL